MKACRKCGENKKLSEYSPMYGVCRDCVKIGNINKRIENGNTPYTNNDITKQKIRKAIRNKDFIYCPESNFSFKQYMIDNSNVLGLMEEHSDNEIKQLLGLNSEDFKVLSEKAMKEFYFLLKQQEREEEEGREPEYICPYKHRNGLDSFLEGYLETSDAVDDYKEDEYDDDY